MYQTRPVSWAAVVTSPTLTCSARADQINRPSASEEVGHVHFGRNLENSNPASLVWGSGANLATMVHGFAQACLHKFRENFGQA